MSCKNLGDFRGKKISNVPLISKVLWYSYKSVLKDSYVIGSVGIGNWKGAEFCIFNKEENADMLKQLI